VPLEHPVGKREETVARVATGPRRSRPEEGEGLEERGQSATSRLSLHEIQGTLRRMGCEWHLVL
jgi:hypothetical protein